MKGLNKNYMNFIKLNILFFTLFIFSKPNLCIAQSDQVSTKFDYITIANGLPQNTVQCIEKDQFGFMWFGTDNGLCRYDGYEFIYYGEGQNSGLLDNRIINITSDNNGYLWVTTPKGGQILNLKTEQFEQPTQQKVKELLSKKIKNIKNINNTLWVVTQNDGIYKIIPNKNLNKIQIADIYYKDATYPAPINIFKGYSNNIYLGTEKGIFQYNDSTNSFLPIKISHIDNSTLYIQAIYEDQKNLWIGTLNGIFKISNTKDFIKWYAHDPLDRHTISHPSVTCIESDKKNHILVGTLAGFHKYNAKKDNFNKIDLLQTKEESTHDIFIRSIFSDSIGNVWIATEKTGLIHYNIFQKNFYSFLESEPSTVPINQSIINSIYQNEKELWVGTAGNGIIHYNERTHSIHHFKNQINNPGSVQSNYITTLIKGPNKEIWAGTWGRGIQIFNKTNNTISKRYHLEDGLPSDFISSLYQCENGQIAIGTNSGIAIYNPINKICNNLVITNNTTNSTWGVGCIIEDNKGYLWIGTTNGLHRFKRSLISDDYRISNYDIVTYQESSDSLSLPNNYITCLEKDKNGNIWIGTYGNGIAKCIPNEDGTASFINYTTKNGLANNVVYKILSDDKNNLWISTENGLSKFNQKENIFHNFFAKDGLRNNQYYWNAAYKSKDGKLYFGGMNGLNYFYPDSITKTNLNATTYITDLKVFNKSVKPSEERHGNITLKNAIFTTDTLCLSYKDNVFSFEFSSLPYFSTSKIKYAYQMEGVDKDFVIVPSNRRVASYTNLQGGEYIFKVKATNTDGEWTNNSKKILLIIKPPFYKTAWFKYAMFLTFFLLLYGYIKYRSFRITEQKKRLEEIVTQRTNELNEKNIQLEDSKNTLISQNTQLAQRQDEIEKQKTLLEKQNKEIIEQRDTVLNLNKEIKSIHQMRMQFFTNISHEFRTPLTLIIAPIERLLRNDINFSKEEIQKTLQYVKRNGERLLLLTNEIMKFRKIETGKLNIKLTKGDVGSYIHELAEAFRPLALQKNINFHVAIDFNLKDIWFDKLKIEDILFNLLSNAIKYTPSNGDVALYVSVLSKENGTSQLFMNIQDTGIGIPEESKDKIFDRFYRDSSSPDHSSYGTGIGLAITKQIIEAMNGSISMDSEVNKGSSFKVLLPIEESDFPEHKKITNDETTQVSLKEKISLLVNHESDKDLHSTSKTKTETNKPSILIVDDNNDLREFLAEALSQNYNIYTAKDGEEGYKTALEKDLEIIVSDIMMPNVNGIELCKQLKNNLHTSHLPIILLTAKGQDEDFIEGLETGADDYISKPFSLAILQAKINSLVENRKKLKRMFQNSTDNLEAETITTNSIDESFLEKVNQVIAENYTNPSFDIDSFASKMYVSRSLLYKKLKALTNVSPNEYVNIYRLKKSVELLKNTNMQISEVAFQIGFNDPKYFSRVFKKFYKCSPSAYNK